MPSPMRGFPLPVFANKSPILAIKLLLMGVFRGAVVSASASVKIISDAVRDWRKAGKSDRMQLGASGFEVTDAAKLDER